MPPKRKRNAYASDSESDDVPPRRPTATALLPEVMQNIERLKAKRDRFRKNITEQFEAFAAGKKKGIEAHYASQAEQRSSEARNLLTRYAEALKQRAAIEKSIEEIVLNAREDLRELTILLEAAYSGRQQQASAAIGSFAAASNKGAVLDTQTVSGDAKEVRAGESACARDTKRSYGRRHGVNVFDRILW